MQLRDFEGRWQIDRQIANAVGPDARFEGEAIFAPGEGGLVLSESGVMHVAGQAPMRAARRYIWRAAEAGIEVWFEDGRFFHLIGLGAAVTARHDCDPDRYLVAYDFSDPRSWTSVWKVTGPRKDYRMETRYTLGPVDAG